MANPANSTAYRLPDGRMAVNVTEAKTLAVTDCGYVQNVAYASGVVTLPATATEGMWIIRNAGVVGTGKPEGSAGDGNLVSVSPNANDNIEGGVSGTATDDKDLQNTAATARVGDEVTILNNARTGGPLCVGIKGVWAREA